ncbi:hypothetical protein C8Q76DRAFT_3515 [Earliella scabrosa]|nr:hypothetical protein C8Q76DRAFT_3515 [Earliella scabrosa]
MASDNLKGTWYVPIPISSIAHSFPSNRASQTDYLTVASVVLIVCEHISTAQQEYEMVWKRKLSLPTALFIINRYVLMILAAIYPLSTLAWWQDDWLPSDFEREDQPQRSALDCQLFTSMRVHAINDRKWSWTFLVSLLGLIAIMVNIMVVASAAVGTNAPRAYGCYGTLGVVGPSRQGWISVPYYPGLHDSSGRPGPWHYVVPHVWDRGWTGQYPSTS